MNLQKYLGRWHRFTFRDGGEIEGFLVKVDDAYGIVTVQGESAIKVSEDDIVQVDEAKSRPAFRDLVPKPGKKVSDEGDLFEFMGRQVRIHWKKGGTSEGRLERSPITGGRLALSGPSSKQGEGERSGTVEWLEMDRIEAL